MSDRTVDTSSLDALWLERIAEAISHELRSSSRQIKSVTQLLGMGHRGSTSGDNDDLQSLVSAADTLQARIDAIDWYFGLAAGELECQPSSLVRILQAAMTDIASEIEEAQADVAVAGVEAGDALLDVDPDRLRQVFVALMRNSIRFCDNPARVAVSYTLAEDSMEVVVADSGPGFSAIKPQDAFAMFRRFHGSDAPGLGVGLAGVQAIIERHRGTVAISSSPEAGTSVAITLPR